MIDASRNRTRMQRQFPNSHNRHNSLSNTSNLPLPDLVPGSLQHWFCLDTEGGWGGGIDWENKVRTGARWMSGRFEEGPWGTLKKYVGLVHERPGMLIMRGIMRLYLRFLFYSE